MPFYVTIHYISDFVIFVCIAYIELYRIRNDICDKDLNL